MRSIRRVPLLFLLALVAACATVPSSLQTPEGRAAFRATEAAERVTQLQSAAITANDLGALSDSASILIVRFTVGALKTIKSSPSGWLESTETGLAELKRQLTDEQRKEPNIALALATLDALLLTIRTGQGGL